MMSTDADKITKLEQKLAQLEQKNAQLVKHAQDLNHRVSLLERENNRRKGEVNQIANAINRKGN